MNSLTSFLFYFYINNLWRFYYAAPAVVVMMPLVISDGALEGFIMETTKAGRVIKFRESKKE